MLSSTRESSFFETNPGFEAFLGNGFGWLCFFFWVRWARGVGQGFGGVVEKALWGLSLLMPVFSSPLSWTELWGQGLVASVGGLGVWAVEVSGKAFRRYTVDLTC